MHSKGKNQPNPGVPRNQGLCRRALTPRPCCCGQELDSSTVTPTPRPRGALLPPPASSRARRRSPPPDLWFLSTGGFFFPLLFILGGRSQAEKPPASCSSPRGFYPRGCCSHGGAAGKILASPRPPPERAGVPRLLLAPWPRAALICPAHAQGVVSSVRSSGPNPGEEVCKSCWPSAGE